MGLVVVALGLSMVGASHADLINPGFEDGDFTGWTLFGEGWRVSSGGDAYEGNWGAVNDVLPTDNDEWRGMFQNVSVTEGLTYTAGVYIRAVNLETSSSWFELQWLDASDGIIGQLQSATVSSDQDFTFMGVTDVVAPSGAVAASIRGIVQRPSAPSDGDFHIFDSFSIIPEPGTMGLLIFSGLGLALLRRRR